jgi:hypothetical protein
MSRTTSPRSPVDRLLASYTRPHAFIERTESILARLGYRIVASEALESPGSETADHAAQPDLLIVDETRLDEVRGLEHHAQLPIILLTGRRGATETDSRIVAAINRPVGLHDLYRVVQQVFEESPRSLPRVSTDLPAQCLRGEESWTASLLSLSENGGLLRSEVRPPLGACFALSFELPGAGTLELRAEAAYELMPDLGIVFSGIDPADRSAIGEFVDDCILA